MIAREKIHETIIRRILIEDVDEIHAIETQTFTTPWSKRSYRFEISENKNSRPWVVEIVSDKRKAIIAGMLVLWIIVDEAHIANFAIKNEFRNLGLGKKLIAKAIIEALAEGTQCFHLDVRWNNEIAQKIYFKIGFRTTGVRKNYYKDTGEDALLMSASQLNTTILEKWLNPQEG